jgi:molybdate transport system ATP-binding protein
MTVRIAIAETSKLTPGEGSPPEIVTNPELDKPRVTLAVRLQKRIARQSAEQDAKNFVLTVEFAALPGFTILFGASGAGKTVLLDCISGLATPDVGRISIGDRVLFDSAKKIDLPPARRRTGYVFQDLALFPQMTVEQNVEYGLAQFSRSQRRELSTAILKALRIYDLAQRKPQQISGGERQRVALARTLVTNPEVLLLDEPLAALDAPAKARILDDLRLWNQNHGIPIVYVTHSREEVFALGERAIVMDGGRILTQGTPHDVLDAPRQETIAHLAGFENIFDAIVESLHVDRGTMTCTLGGHGKPVLLETPLIRADAGSRLRVGIRAGDILLATVLPVGLSARNVLPGRVTGLLQRDVMVLARVNCGVEMEVHLTLAARDALEVQPGREVWLVIKTHSCHLMQR